MIIITLADIFICVIVLGFMLKFGVISYKEHRRQSKCRHDQGYNETQACDAICRACGKNLGFIGLLRDKP